MDFNVEGKNEDCVTWIYEGGLEEYLLDSLTGSESIPTEVVMLSARGEGEAVDYALKWLIDANEVLNESYVNLIPTPQGGTHVSGLRSGLTDALREFCDFHSLIPKGIKLTGDDLWAQCSYVLSVKLTDPQFAGQTKERLSSRQSSIFVEELQKTLLAFGLMSIPRREKKLPNLLFLMLRREQTQQKK